MVGVPSIGETLGGLAARVRPGPHGHPRGGAAGRRARARGASAARRSRPRKGDRRFTDPAWSGNPIFYRIERGYLATAQAVGNVVERARPRARTTAPRRAGPVRHHHPHQRAGPDQLPRHEPGRAQARVRHRRQAAWCAGSRQLRRRRAQQRRHAVDGRAATRSRWAATSRSTPGAVVAPRRGGRAASSTSRAPSRCHTRPLSSSRRRSAASTSSTCARAAASSSTPSARASQMFLLQLAQPQRRAGRVEPRHLRAAACATPSTPCARSPAATTST